MKVGIECANDLRTTSARRRPWRPS